MTRFMSDIK